MASAVTLDPQASAPARDFAAWMASEQRRVFLLCHRMLGEWDEADSATQDVFLKAYRALQHSTAGAELQEPARWLTRVAVNTCLDRLRSRRWKFWRRRPAPDDEALLLALEPEGSPDAEARIFAAQIDARLQSALERLSPRQRAVFALRHYEGLSLEEIGNALGLDVGTVKAHLARALQKLREDLRDLYHAAARAEGSRR